MAITLPLKDDHVDGFLVISCAGKSVEENEWILKGKCIVPVYLTESNIQLLQMYIFGLTRSRS